MVAVRVLLRGRRGLLAPERERGAGEDLEVAGAVGLLGRLGGDQVAGVEAQREHARDVELHADAVVADRVDVVTGDPGLRAQAHEAVTAEDERDHPEERQLQDAVAAEGVEQGAPAGVVGDRQCRALELEAEEAQREVGHPQAALERRPAQRLLRSGRWVVEIVVAGEYRRAEEDADLGGVALGVVPPDAGLFARRLLTLLGGAGLGPWSSGHRERDQERVPA
ncbi:hypothetical protein OV079_26385 [Nannocystis pusilla]|uniref:Uncharacterized protein n=1 Tax=Nannocystis pusilla TaxID=889268 RepID=A0A9X3ET99_9BACT|nr:hypothetical protein [Nannocystis pusilla]MCY1009024.1 hypothetical protein [Nannocystis pusilla]